MIKKLFQAAITAIILMASTAHAAGFTVFENTEQCEFARTAGKAVVYTPTTKAPFKGGEGWVKKSVPAGGACLGNAYVLEDGAPKNGKSVFVAEGFQYWEHTSGAFRMNDCSNPFGQIVFAGKKAEPAPVAPPPGATVPCGTDGCGNVTINQTVTHVVTEVKVCVGSDGKEFPAVNGECKFAPTKVLVSAKVVPPTTDVACPGNCNKPHVDVTRKVARTDGRCVLVLEHDGVEHFVRFDTTKMTNLLVAARVSNANGDWVHSNPLGLVGDDKQTVKLDVGNQCSAAIAAFTSDRSFAPTAKRIGLPTNCKPKGQV